MRIEVPSRPRRVACLERRVELFIARGPVLPLYVLNNRLQLLFANCIATVLAALHEDPLIDQFEQRAPWRAIFVSRADPIKICLGYRFTVDCGYGYG